jgi:peptidyl-tRNA hydrolase, PTH1 family
VGELAVIVGLGNPGRTYARSRHNAGFRVVLRLAERHGVAVTTRKFGALTGRGAVARRPALLALPQTFMNASGEAVAPLLGYFRAEPADLVVVHDDVDLAFGRLKLKQGGGTGGHKGLASLVGQLGTDAFVRVRVGIGRPEPVGDVTDWVLERFSPDEEAALDAIVEEAADAVEAVLADGAKAAMNRFNARRAPEEAEEE